MQKIATVSELYIFPIKSCAGLAVNKAIVTKLGFALVDNPQVADRKWMVVDENGSFVTQRQIPKMALIKPKIDGDNLILTADGMPDLVVPIKAPSNKRNCRCWESHLQAHSYGDEVSKWLSTFLGRDNLDLVSFADDVESRKLVDLPSSKAANDVKLTDEVIYADYAPFMLLSESSLNDLNKRLAKPVTVRQFRPNILVKDCQAYDEDEWIKFQIGNVKFRNIKHGTRCLLTTVDPIVGEKSKDEEPLKTLKTFRQNIEKYGVSPLFGINLCTDSIDENQIISVNDPIFRH